MGTPRIRYVSKEEAKEGICVDTYDERAIMDAAYLRMLRVKELAKNMELVYTTVPFTDKKGHVYKIQWQMFLIKKGTHDGHGAGPPMEKEQLQ